MSKLAKYKELKFSIDKFKSINQFEAIQLRNAGWNDLQIVASGISGYEPNKPWSSAKDDYYYDLCPTFAHKITQIEDYAREIYNIYNLGICEMKQIQQWLDTEFICADDRYHAFKKLGEE